MRDTPLLYVDGFTEIGARSGDHPGWRVRLDQLVEDLERCGIAAAFVASAHYSDIHGENLKLTGQLREHPHLHPVWTVLPSCMGVGPGNEDWPTLLREHGVRMLRIAPKPHFWDPLEPSHRDFFRALAAAGVPVALSAEDIEFRDLKELPGLYPEIPFLLRRAHFGQLGLLLPLLKRHKNLHVGFDLLQSMRGPEGLVGEGLEDQLLFLSSGPRMSIGAQRALIDWADIPETAARKIAAENLLRLTGLDAPAVSPLSNDPLRARAQLGRPLDCLVFDMHSHLLERGVNGCTMPMPGGDPAGMRELGLRIGIDGVAVMSWNGIQDLDPVNGNRHVREAIEDFPDYYRGLPTFDIRDGDSERLEGELGEAFADPRMVGIKPYFTYGVPFDDTRYDPLWRYAEQHGLYVGVHPTRWYQDGEFEAMLERFPDIRLLAFHAGCDFDIADTVIGICRRHPNVWAEITYSSVPGGIIEHLANSIGADRVLFGTDQPLRDPRSQLGWVLYADLSLEDRRKILGENARQAIPPEKFFGQ